MQDIVKFNFKLSPYIKQDMLGAIFRQAANGKRSPYGGNDFTFVWTFTEEEKTLMDKIYWGPSAEWEKFITEGSLAQKICRSPEFIKCYEECMERAKKFEKTVPENFERYRGDINDFVASKMSPNYSLATIFWLRATTILSLQRTII